MNLPYRFATSAAADAITPNSGANVPAWMVRALQTSEIKENVPDTQHSSMVSEDIIVKSPVIDGSFTLYEVSVLARVQ